MLRELLLCTAEVKSRFREIEECFDSVIGRLIIEIADETPALNTIWECWNRLQPYIQRLFDRIEQLRQIQNEGEPVLPRYLFGDNQLPDGEPETEPR